MSAANKHIRHGIGSVRPYLYGDLKVPELVKHAFGAQELERLPAGNGFHIEAKIGDSMIVLEAGDPPHPDGTRASIYVYVEDVDAAYKRALEAGATSVAAPADKPYQERTASVKDTYGNTWWLATYTG
ncbi:MAG TPA: VOC family protein [Candidatus Binataceae bacterium]|nr:VOC family protein [Candidatus Binataceae bacterium]